MAIHRRVVRGVASLGALAVAAALAVSAAAQPAPVRVVQSSDGTLYVVQGASTWTLVPDPVSDTDLAGLNPVGDIDGTLGPQPGPLHVVQASDGGVYLMNGQAAWTLVPDQLGDSDLAALTVSGELDGVIPAELLSATVPQAPTAALPGTGPAASPAAGFVGTWVSIDPATQRVRTVKLEADGSQITGTWRGETSDGQCHTVYQLAGALKDGTLELTGPAIVDQTTPPCGGGWCPANSDTLDVVLSSPDQLTGMETGCGAGPVLFTKVHTSAADLAGTWVLTLDPQRTTPIQSLALTVSGNTVTGTWRAESTDHRLRAVYQVTGTFSDGTVRLGWPAITDQTPGANWCGPNSGFANLVVSPKQLTGIETGCGAGPLQFNKS